MPPAGWYPQGLGRSLRNGNRDSKATPPDRPTHQVSLHQLRAPESLTPTQAKAWADLLITNGVVFATDDEALKVIENCS